MPLDSRFGALPLDPRTVVMEIPDALAAEAIESVENTEFAFHFAPARGIVNALAFGVGVWTIIFAAVALTRAILSA